MGCDGQPILPFLREELESIGGILSALGVAAPGAGVAEPGARRPHTERGNLKAPEVTQLNYRLTTKLHKEKVCNAPRLPGAMRSRGRKRRRYRKEPPCAGGSLAVCLGSGQKRRLANFSPHCLSRGHRMRADRQLQHRRALTLAQARDQYHLPIREFQRIVMGHGVVEVDLPEAHEPLPDLLVWQNAEAKRRLAFDILIERKFGAGQQADRNIRLANRCEPSRDGIWEFGRYQLVLDPGRPGCDMVQTIVTHRRNSFFLWKAGMFLRLNKPPQVSLCRMLSRLASNAAISSPGNSPR